MTVMSVSSNIEKNSRQIKRWQKRVSVSFLQQKKILVKSKVVKSECRFFQTIKNFSQNQNYRTLIK